MRRWWERRPRPDVVPAPPPYVHLPEIPEPDYPGITVKIHEPDPLAIEIYPDGNYFFWYVIPASGDGVKRNDLTGRPYNGYYASNCENTLEKARRAAQEYAEMTRSAGLGRPIERWVEG